MTPTLRTVVLSVLLTLATPSVVTGTDTGPNTGRAHGPEWRATVRPRQHAARQQTVAAGAARVLQNPQSRAAAGPTTGTVAKQAENAAV
jgi:hypothetical protein